MQLPVKGLMRSPKRLRIRMPERLGDVLCIAHRLFGAMKQAELRVFLSTDLDGGTGKSQWYQSPGSKSPQDTAQPRTPTSRMLLRDNFLFRFNIAIVAPLY